MNQETILVGDKVHYVAHDKVENGIVKEIPVHTKNAVRVVYHCNGDWDNYSNYTSALTEVSDLLPGWDSELGFNAVNDLCATCDGRGHCPDCGS